MPPMTPGPKIAVIGGGWYGCHVALVCRDIGLDVTVFEHNDELFKHASGLNQYRSHLGFHYCRSHETRIECLLGYQEMRKRYPDLAHEISDNFYVIANESNLDFPSYTALMRESGLSFEAVDPKTFGLQNCQGVLRTKEGVFHPQATKEYFSKELEGRVRLSTSVKEIKQNPETLQLMIDNEAFDLVVGATYGCFGPLESPMFYEPCVTLLYSERGEKERPLSPSRRGEGSPPNPSVKCVAMGITVVDGPFGSLLPVQERGRLLCTLTSVVDTPLGRFTDPVEAAKFMETFSEEQGLEKRELFEKMIARYVTGFSTRYQYEGFFTSMKTKNDCTDSHANRSCHSEVHFNGRFLQVLGGKISGIFEAERQMYKLLADLVTPEMPMAVKLQSKIRQLSETWQTYLSIGCEQKLYGLGALIGCTGFVGSILRRDMVFSSLLNSSNIEEIRGKEFDYVVCASLPAAKWIANKEPEADRANMRALVEHMKTISCGLFVLISTVDVLPDVAAGYSEGQTADIRPEDAPHPYGKHRLEFEHEMQRLRDEGRFERLLILRLPALFGRGLKKNIVFDLIYNNNVDRINADTAFQWYDCNRLAQDIDVCLNSGQSGVVHIAPEPLHTARLVTEVFGDCWRVSEDGTKVEEPKSGPHEDEESTAASTGSPSEKEKEKMPPRFRSKPTGPRYDFHSEHALCWGKTQGPYLFGAEDTLMALRRFVSFERCKQLAVSNIAWAHADRRYVGSVLRDFGISCVEVAPTMIWPGWKGITKASVLEFRREMHRLGVEIGSLQAVLFGKPELLLFGTREERNRLMDHMRFVVEIASLLGATKIVFGSPRNRQRGGVSLEMASSIACKFFKKLGDFAHLHGVCVCIENVPKDYNCDWINTPMEAAELVKKVGSPGFQSHLDIGNCAMAGVFEEVEAQAAQLLDTIGHVHVSEPGLLPLDKVSDRYERLCRLLSTLGYEGRFCLEMKNAGLPNLIQSVAVLRSRCTGKKGNLTSDA